jgi:glycosyltransferase involved in cell wall biosynthesis
MPNKDELDKLTLDESVAGSIRICGLMQNDKVPQKLADASCQMTTPNFYVSGGFPTKIGEYMLSGVPVVATNAGDLLKYIEPEKEMLFSEPGDLHDIARNLLRIENDPESGTEMAARARKKVLAVFNADSYAQDLCRFLSPARD